MKLIVGLGNPGSEYVGTRHNVGFDVLDAVAERLGWVRPGEFDRQAKSAFDGLTVDGMLNLSTGGVEKVLLLKPMTYMNVSGKSVRAAMDFFKLTPPEVLIIVDELALPCGTIRLKPDGRDGGHNGLKSIQQMLGTDRYPRLRIGIDPPPPPMAGRDYVLGRFTPAQKPVVAKAVGRAAGCVATWADAGIVKAMNQFNTDPAPAAGSGQ
jgi:PTH1 family peptidyl-tRNA hydrolase